MVQGRGYGCRGKALSEIKGGVKMLEMEQNLRGVGPQTHPQVMQLISTLY